MGLYDRVRSRAIPDIRGCDQFGQLLRDAGLGVRGLRDGREGLAPRGGDQRGDCYDEEHGCHWQPRTAKAHHRPAAAAQHA
jgi:hypothetical protein